jgi:hypothetical protein
MEWNGMKRAPGLPVINALPGSGSITLLGTHAIHN